MRSSVSRDRGDSGCYIWMKEWDVNATENTGSTALAWAAVRGHKGIVKVLFGTREYQPGPGRLRIWPDTPLVGGWERA